MSEPVYCPYCADPISGEAVTLWDDRVYCRKCVEDVSSEFYHFVIDGGRLVDVVAKYDVSVLRYVVNYGRKLLTFLFLLFLVLYLLFVFAGKADLAEFISVFIFFSSGCIVILLLKTLIGMPFLRANLPRTVSVNKKQLVIQTTQKVQEVPLSECNWFFGSTFGDELCMLTGLHQGIVILTPEKCIACGHSPEMLDHWNSFLTLSGIPCNAPPSHWKVPILSGLGAIVGTLTGAAVGYTLSLITSHEKWIPVSILLGVCEGILITFFYAIYKYDNYESTKQEIKKVFRSGLLDVMFFVVAFIIGGLAIGGLQEGLLCGSINAVIVFLTLWFYRSRIRADELQCERREQFRPETIEVTEYEF